jgi:hypothetical protein
VAERKSCLVTIVLSELRGKERQNRIACIANRFVRSFMTSELQVVAIKI